MKEMRAILMKLGVRAHDLGRCHAKELAKQLREYGFDTCQLAIPKAITGIETFSQITPDVLEEIKREFQDQNMEIAVLGCYIEPAELDNTIRNQQIDIFKQALEYSKVIGARVVGTETTRFNMDEGKRRESFNILLNSVDQMVNKAEAVGAYVGIEPVHVHTLNTPELTNELLHIIDSDHLSIIFDPVNLIHTGNVENQESLLKECFDAFGKKISAIHLKDFKVDNGQILPTRLGIGRMEYDYLFEWLHKNKPDIAILREELCLKEASQEIDFMKQLISYVL